MTVYVEVGVGVTEGEEAVAGVATTPEDDVAGTVIPIPEFPLWLDDDPEENEDPDEEEDEDVVEVEDESFFEDEDETTVADGEEAVDETDTIGPVVDEEEELYEE